MDYCQKCGQEMLETAHVCTAGTGESQMTICPKCGQWDDVTGPAHVCHGPQGTIFLGDAWVPPRWQTLIEALVPLIQVGTRVLLKLEEELKTPSLPDQQALDEVLESLTEEELAMEVNDEADVQDG